MATIDQLDLNVYSMYALRITMIEQINSTLRLNEASSIPPQLQIVDSNPKLTELDLLLGIVPLATPWAYFYPPKRYQNIRRNTFSFFSMGPSFGTLAEQEKEEEFIEKLPCEDEEDKNDKKVILKCFKQRGKINQMKAYIIGRMGQFLQG